MLHCQISELSDKSQPVFEGLGLALNHYLGVQEYTSVINIKFTDSFSIPRIFDHCTIGIIL